MKKFLRLFWTASVLAILTVILSITKSQAQSGDVNSVKYQLFELSDVKLLESPFKKAMKLDGEYLLKLEADRLLAPYLKEAGLEPKAERYGGWESNSEVGEGGLDGHTLGHYLSALSMIYASTGKEKFNDRISYVVDELSRAQKTNETDYIAGVPNGEEILNEVRSGNIKAEPFALNGSWVPWYNLHKIFAGLRDAYRYADKEKALDILIKLADWTVDWADELTDKEFQEVLKTEQGGMKEIMADLFGITGDQKYLYLSKRFTHEAIFEPLENHKDKLAGLHANTQIPKIIGAAREYEVAGNKTMREVSQFFWQTVVNNRSYDNGGNSNHEHFGDKWESAKSLSRATTETCNTYNMLKLTRHLMQWKPDPAYADYYERALYNHILASQDPKTGMFAYFISMESGFFKTFSKPFNSFWCCVGSGMENHTKYGRFIYMHNHDQLYVNLFIPSVLQWEERGIKLRQETKFPKSEKSSFTIQTNEPEKFTLQLRRPYWAGKGFGIRVNGEKITVNQEPSSYIAINRRWKDGDTITVSLPMAIHTESLGPKSTKIAFMNGPLLLAGIVGEQVPLPSQYATKQYDFFDLPTVEVPALQPENDTPESWVKPSGNELQHKLNRVGEANGTTLAPLYKVNHQYYTVYWEVQN